MNSPQRHKDTKLHEGDRNPTRFVGFVSWCLRGRTGRYFLQTLASASSARFLMFFMASSGFDSPRKVLSVSSLRSGRFRRQPSPGTGSGNFCRRCRTWRSCRCPDPCTSGNRGNRRGRHWIESSGLRPLPERHAAERRHIDVALGAPPLHELPGRFLVLGLLGDRDAVVSVAGPEGVRRRLEVRHRRKGHGEIARVIFDVRDVAQDPRAFESAWRPCPSGIRCTAGACRRSHRPAEPRSYPCPASAGAF